MSGVRNPATLGRRVGAAVIDTAVAVLISLVAVGALAGVSLATAGSFSLLAAIVVAYVIAIGWFVVYTWMQGRAGSIGMRALGLRLARAGADAPLGFARALGRNALWGVGAAIIVGMFSPLFDSSPWRRGWHDRGAGAVMTDIAGWGAPLAEPAVTGAGADAGVDAGVDAGARASVPSVLPAAPTPLTPPSLDAPGPAAWKGDARPARVEPGVISFVPGVSDPSRAAAPPGVPEGSLHAPAAPAVPAVPALLSDPMEQTHIARDQPIARLIWDDGGRQAVYGRTVFGRNPTPETGAMITPVRDETLSLSKTHFELVPDEDRALWVVDRHSTNGVVVRRGTQRQQAAPGQRTRVRGGDVLEFGDRHVLIEGAS